MKYIKKLNINFDNWDEIKPNNNVINNLLNKYNIKYNIKYKFIEFVKLLEEYNITDRYFNHLKNETVARWAPLDGKMIEFFNNTSPNTWVSIPFYWNIDDYNWYNIHKEWIKRLLLIYRREYKH